MFSLTWIYQYLGNNNIPDWVEQAAFNALPVAISPDWWSHQYVQQENQPWSRNLTQGTKGLWTNGGPLGQRLWLGAGLCNISCLLPLFPPQRKTLIKHPQPCCTVNHPHAYPKFLANSFALTEDGGIAHVFLGPAALRTTLADGNKASITAETAYPFGFEITLHHLLNQTLPLFYPSPGLGRRFSQLPFCESCNVDQSKVLFLDALILGPGSTKLRSLHPTEPQPTFRRPPHPESKR